MMINPIQTPQAVTALSASVSQMMGSDFQGSMWASEYVPTALYNIPTTHVLRDSTGNAIGNTEVLDS
jgi:hypothetical protein